MRLPIVIKIAFKNLVYEVDGYPKGLYMLVKGKIKTFRTNEFGKEIITGLYKTGEFWLH